MNTLRNSSIVSRPRIAVTIGDPAGIGTEVVLKALADRSLLALNARFTIFGDRRYLEETYNLLRTHRNVIDPDCLEIVDIRTDDKISLGIGNRASGAASFAYLDAAIAQTLAGNYDAIVTAPIAKSAWKQAGHDYAGQTELLAECSQVNDFGMLFVGKSLHTGWVLRTLLATVHIPLSEVTKQLTPELIEQKLE